MDEFNKQELRRKANNALSGGPGGNGDPIPAIHIDAADAISLLDENDQFRAEVEALRQDLRLAAHWCKSALSSVQFSDSETALSDTACLLRHQARYLDAAMAKEGSTND